MFISKPAFLTDEHENSQVERNLTSILAEFGGNKMGLESRFDKIV
jgi:hypothetical protein